MLTWALKYHRAGFTVIPLKRQTKDSPLIPWKEFQNRKPTEQEIIEWWTKWPDANIAGITGKGSNRIVLDLEYAGLKEGRYLSSPLTVLTGKGKHLWMAYKELRNGVALKGIKGLDIRADGGYALLPPSIHPSGRRYRWSVPPKLYNQLPEMPESILETKSAEPLQKKQDGWIAEALRNMSCGNIDNTLTSICGRLRADNWFAADALALLSPHAVRVNAEPGHLEAKIENIWNRYEAHPRAESIHSGLREGTGNLIIHSPTNPDSLKQFEQRNMDTNTEHSLFTGYSKLDRMLQGGFKSSRLLTVAARTGVGKTNWLLGVAREVCRSGKVVLLFSTEMPYQQIWERYIETLEDPEEFKSHKFFVCDSFAPSVERVEEAINACKPAVFMFDHINHVSEEQRELGSFMQGLNYLRRKYDIAGIVTAQLNRQADWIDLKTGEKVTPRMSMIKGSGTIEQASSRVLLLSETRVTPEGTEIIGNLDKNDNGDKGIIHFMLKSKPYRMIEL